MRSRVTAVVTTSLAADAAQGAYAFVEALDSVSVRLE